MSAFESEGFSIGSSVTFVFFVSFFLVFVFAGVSSSEDFFDFVESVVVFVVHFSTISSTFHPFHDHDPQSKPGENSVRVHDVHDASTTCSSNSKRAL